jgi:uncharacterized protein
MNEQVKHSFVWAAAIITALGLLGSTMIATYGFIRTKAQPNTITVTGSAKKQIKSDYVTWRGSFSTQSANLPEAYKKLQNDLNKVKGYLSEKELTENDYTVSSINTIVNYQMLPNGMMSSAVDSYRLYQEVEIRSADIEKITSISRESTKLIQDGIQFQSMPPMYFYTKIADLKIDMLALATKDARNRAGKIAENAGSKLGELKSAKMGVFQITPINSNEVSDYGINDTSSIEKEIMSVVNCVFSSK